MLTSLRIQNFRSIRDATVKLGQVNLFIGPNNSGKSNFLKGIELLTSSIESYPVDFKLEVESFNALLPRSIGNNHSKADLIRFIFKNNHNTESLSIVIGILGASNAVADIKLFSNVYLSHKINSDPYDEEIYNEDLEYLVREVQKDTSGTQLYKIDPIFFALSAELSNQNHLEPEGSNIISFLFALSQNSRKRFRKLEDDFARCIGNLTSVATPVDPEKPGHFRLKFFDKDDIGYWAEEVSEGVLYFLALLCIVHQPDPPKLLLLEEPEKGIHPRRIKEVMDFIFELAELRDIQIILTSHSPYVVDHFADIPECISVFDRENGETVIRNAGDIISETNNKLEAEGKKPIRYTDALGEHWVSGFLGGVPV